MTDAVRASDALVAGLLEQLARVASADEACSLLLARASAESGIGHALLLYRTHEGLELLGPGVSPAQAADTVEQALEPGSAVLDLFESLQDARPVHAPGVGVLDFPAVALPLRGLDSLRGVVFLEATELTPRIHATADLLRRCGPLVDRIIESASSAGRAGRLSRQIDILTDMLNAISDPVVMTNGNGAVVLTNARAEALLTSSADDSDGRRRAVEVNNLLFSSFLTQTAMAGGMSAPGGRELNLVDTHEGSDLLFEVLTMPIGVLGEGALMSVLRDITDLKRAVNELEVQYRRSRVAEHRSRLERDRLNAILENVSDPILVTDEHSNIVLMNAEADRLFVADPLTFGSKRQLIQSNDTRVTTMISNFLLSPEVRQVERITLVDPDREREFPAEIASNKIINARGEPTAIVSVIHDLTYAEENERLANELGQLNEGLEDRIRQATAELEERNRRLEWQSRELEKASRLKSEFLANMSHELRTPINVILGYTSLMRERIYGVLTDQQDEALAKVYNTSQHLLELINDILDLSKIEAGKMPLHLEQVLLPEVIDELGETIEPMVRAKELEFRTSVAPDLPVLDTDRTKLKQVLLNLISNAIKFTHEGHVALTVAHVGGIVRITVEDTGVGIKPEDLEAIFEDFRQIDQSHTREYGGTGLGLSITRKLLTLLGGSIAVESTYGSGTKFVIELPCTAPRPDDVEASQEPA
ncbi:MAG TPA: ATP-binding protein [Longimicrobiales bacterium]|nr:ATP-binding protein [Longimicrobiales bacterium]